MSRALIIIASGFAVLAAVLFVPRQGSVSEVEVEPTNWVVVEPEAGQTEIENRDRDQKTEVIHSVAQDAHTDSATQDQSHTQEAPPREQIVTFNETTNTTQVADALGTDNVEQLTETTYLVKDATVDTSEVEDVASAGANAVFRALGRPNDSAFGNQVGLSNISATDAWDIETGHHTVRIAVIDSGVNGLHEDLYGKVIEGYDFVNDTAIARNADSDDNGHGTGVASVAAAKGNNTTGMTGMAWDVEIMPVKVLNSFGFGYTREVVLGMEYAIDNGADIVVMSIGSNDDAQALEDAIDSGWNSGQLTVAAAGNDGPTDLLFPARYDHVLSVGATNGSDTRASFSNIGLTLDVMAPGVGIYHATDSDNSYSTSNGTSFAAPLVAGTAALIKSRHPGISAEEMFNAIRDNTDTVAGMNGAGRTDFYGYGRLNARAALQAIEGNYAASLVSKSENIPALGATQSWQVEYKYRNTGTSVWKGSDPYRAELATANDTDHVLTFTREDMVTNRPSGWLSASRVRMVESEVRPGGTGTFQFWVSVPQGMSAGTYINDMQLAINDVGVVDDTASSFSIQVLDEKDRYHAAWDGQSPNPTLSAGQSNQFTVRLKNVGNKTWERHVLKLGTAHDQNRISAFTREDVVGSNPSGWQTPTRIWMNEHRVAPGEVGTFTFWMSVPSTLAAGTYREYFQPIAEGFTWMEDLGIYWDITVQ